MNKVNSYNALFLFAVAVLTLFIYNPAALYFLNDDMIHLPLSSKGILFQHNSFRPIHDLLLRFEYQLWGINAAGYHFVEWGIHILCCVLVYRFSNLLFYYFSDLPVHKRSLSALFTTALFALYAFHSESVLWVLGSGASLVTVFFLLSVIAYLRKSEGLIYYLLSLFWFQVGLFTYEAIWVAPLFIALLYWMERKRNPALPKHEWIYPALYCFSFLFNLIIRKVILGEIGGSYGTDKLFDFNIKKLLYNGLCLFARSFIPPAASVAMFAASLLIALLLIAIAVRKLFVTKAFNPLFILLALSFLGGLLPVISLGISTHSRESERFLYLPSVFLCILIVYSLITLTSSIKNFLMLISLLLIYHTYYTFINARDYAVAGAISKSVYQHFATENSSKDTVIINGFPRQFNGLPLFRIGFKEGVSWLYHTDTNLLIIPASEQLVATKQYHLFFTKRDFVFTIHQKTINHHQSLSFLYDSSYFTLTDFDRQ